MSPYIRKMLEDAADDEGRPVGLDLAAVRTAGRRATWRHRALIGGGGVTAAAVITSVALLLAPGGPGNGFQPTDDGTSEPKPTETAMAMPFEDAFAPLIDALRTNGYDVAESPFSSTVSVANQPAPGDDLPTYLTAGTLSVKDGDAVGAAIAAEFSDVSAVTDIMLGDTKLLLPGDVDGYDYTEQCAVLPTNVHLSDFAWDRCEESEDGLQRIATGGDAYGDAIGVTLLRPDGSGVSLAVSTAAYDRDADSGEPATPPLDQIPLTSDELTTVAQAMLDTGPMFPPPVEGEVTGDPAGDGMAGTAVPEKCPPDGSADECAVAESITIEAGPLLDALAAAGAPAAEMGGSGSGGSAGEVVQSSLFQLTDSEGRTGIAAVGIASSIDAAELLNDPSVAWCAVSPTFEPGYRWQLADDPSTPCSDGDLRGAEPLVVVHDEVGADGIGATMVRSDGSVISVSLSQAAMLKGPDPEGTPLAVLPLDRAALLEVLAQLDAANPVS